LATVGLTAVIAGAHQATPVAARPDAAPAAAQSVPAPALSVDAPIAGAVWARFMDDMTAVESFRPAYRFWQHIFLIPDGSIVFGSAADGRLLASLPSTGTWARADYWSDPTLARAVAGARFDGPLAQRRTQVAALLEPVVGPVIHNPTRGLFLLPHAEQYGGFLEEWSAIYARFGVPPALGLAQAVLESGLNGRARSAANALGLCQWLRPNWAHLDRLAPYVLEAYNQTTQAAYCAAYLQVLATMYGSFIPALSEHHAGGVNVGRMVINGERLGAATTREQYLVGAQFSRSLRQVSLQQYQELFRTYGPRSFLYAEMVFGNMPTVERLVADLQQQPIHAMRTSRAVALADIVRRTGLSEAEVKRYNPALVRQVPARATIYLPVASAEFGDDVSFWRRPADPGFTAVLDEFVQLDAGVQAWHQPAFGATLQDYRRRFEQTGTEEGMVMATVLAYMADDLRTSRRAAILDEFRTSRRILGLFEQGMRELGVRAAP
jgi:hypothetical protein